MNLNPNFFISILFSIVLFIIGLILSKKILIKKNQRLILIFSFTLTFPGISMILYYFHFFETPLWYVNFRTIPAIEISISFIGLYLGFLSNNKNKYFLIGITIFLVLIPYIKPIIRPLTIKNITEWNDEVCIQSTVATCGPSSLATILKYFKVESTELEIAKNSYTCNTGTEIWYLLRIAKRKGLEYSLNTINKVSELRFPSIIGTRLFSVGHFVTVLGRSGNEFIIGDPLLGKLVLTEDEFKNKYTIDGLMIVFTKN